MSFDQQTILAMHIRVLVFLGFLSFAASPCAAETNVRNPNDPAQLLEYAETQADILKQQAADGKISGAEYRAFEAKVAAFRNWYNCVQMDPVWEPGSPVMLRLSPEEFDFNEGNIGPDVGLAGNIETTMTTLANPVTGTRIQIGYDVQNPINPGFAVYYLLGTYTNDVVLVAPGSGYWSALALDAQLKLCSSAKTLGGSVVVDQQQFNRMLVDIYKDFFGGIVDPPPPPPPIWLVLLVVEGVLALLFVPLVLRLVFLRKRRGKDCCPFCGSPMKRGVCPHCGPSGIVVAPIEICPSCGSELVDGICPNGCELKLVRSETGGSGE